MSAANRRIQLLQQWFVTPSQGFTINCLAWNKTRKPGWQDLDRAIQAIESELVPQ